MLSDFVTFAPCVPDAYKSPKKQNNLWYASHRMFDRLISVVEYPVCVISVAVLVAVVKRHLCLLVSVVFYNRRSTVYIITSLNCNTEFWDSLFFELRLNGSGLGHVIFQKMSPRTRHKLFVAKSLTAACMICMGLHLYMEILQLIKQS